MLGKKVMREELFSGGYAAMIALIWNLPTRHTSVFSLNTLLADESRHILLDNGALVRVHTLAALSVDLGGKADVSFWSMYANTHAKLRYYLPFIYLSLYLSLSLYLT